MTTTKVNKQFSRRARRTSASSAMASTKTSKTGPMKEDSDWYLPCSDDEVYVESGCAKGNIGCKWEPDVAVAVELFEQIEKQGVLPLQWKCLQGMRRPSNSDDEEEAEDNIDAVNTSTSVGVGAGNNSNKNDFDFDDDEDDDNNGAVKATVGTAVSKTPLAHTGRRNRPELKGSARKKTTSFDGVISSLKRHRQLDKASKREREKAKQSPNSNAGNQVGAQKAENKMNPYASQHGPRQPPDNQTIVQGVPVGAAASQMQGVQQTTQSSMTSPGVQQSHGNVQTPMMNNVTIATSQSAMLTNTMHINHGMRGQMQPQMNVVHHQQAPQQGQQAMIRGQLRVIPTSSPQFQTVSVNNQPIVQSQVRTSQPSQLQQQFIQINPQQRRQPIFVQQQTSLDGSQQYFQAIHPQQPRPQYQQVIIQNQQPMQVIPMQQSQQVIFQAEQHHPVEQQQHVQQQHVGQFATVQATGHTFVRASQPGSFAPNYSADNGQNASQQQ